MHDDSQRCRDFMAALVTDDSNAAERDFDARMRAELPPPLLKAHWHELLAKHGRLASWRVSKRDGLYQKDRFTLELAFTNGVSYALVVFEARGQIVGLFFSEPHQAERAAAGAPLQGEVAVVVGPLNLPGSLSLPPLASARVPGVVFVAGSGPSDRDEAVGGARPFRDLARGLSEQGIASLRFDKRTFARPESFDKRNTTVETETIEDAVAAIELLRARPELDASRIFVVGHSLGALLAPEIAKRAGTVAGLVLLAAPGRPLPELMLEQLRARGASQQELAALETRVKALPNLAPTEVVLGVPAVYWQDLAKRDELAVARELNIPVLLLRGAADRQVAALDQQRWIDALSGHVPLSAATLPGLSHLFVPEPASAEPHVPSDLIARIGSFVQHPAGA